MPASLLISEPTMVPAPVEPEQMFQCRCHIWRNPRNTAPTRNHCWYRPTLILSIFANKLPTHLPTSEKKRLVLKRLNTNSNVKEKSAPVRMKDTYGSPLSTQPITRGSVQNRLTFALAEAAGPLTYLRKSATCLPRGRTPQESLGFGVGGESLLVY